MLGYDDYYEVLQVHHLAEPEVIESAYKRLLKKYHPDVNKSANSEELTQKINLAYEVLSDSDRRRNYDAEWKNRLNKAGEFDNNLATAYSKAVAILEEYLRNIMANSLHRSYELISNMDKRNISREDFITWQSAVAKIFCIKDYSCRICEACENVEINCYTFSLAVKVSVEMIEYNEVMDMLERNDFSKLVVYEAGEWRVYIGHESIQPLISKFKALKGLLAAKSVIDELVEIHSKADKSTGLLNKSGITERIENEILRFDRYGNIFSLIICVIYVGKTADTNIKQEINEHAVRYVGEVLKDHLRKLDVLGRWGADTILILLPETGVTSAIKATRKIRRVLKAEKLMINGSIYNISITFGVAQYEHSLEETLSRAINGGVI